MTEKMVRVSVIKIEEYDNHEVYLFSRVAQTEIRRCKHTKSVL